MNGAKKKFQVESEFKKKMGKEPSLNFILSQLRILALGPNLYHTKEEIQKSGN